jgi:hypothetical protein
VASCVSVAQIVGAVGFGGARLAVPDPDPATAPAPLPDLMRRCFAAPGERPTASAIRAALEEALPRTTAGHVTGTTGGAMDGVMPREFECPLTLEVMRDPVTAQDGRSYGKLLLLLLGWWSSGCFGLTTALLATAERAAIETWINTAAVLRSPVTNEPMGPNLVPNVTLRTLIRDYCAAHGIKPN